MHPQVEYLLSLQYDPQRSNAWLEMRGKMLTASDAGTALGVNPYETPNDFILKKCGHSDFKGNAATEHGNKFEDEARDLYCERYGEVSHEIGLYQHPVYPWLGGSPDGLTESGKLIEIKCPLRRKISNEVPIYYMAQVQLLLEILNLEEAVFIQYKPSSLTWPQPYEFVVTNVIRDREWWNESLPKLHCIWDKVLLHREIGCDELIVTKPKKERKARKKKCLIIHDDEHSPNVFSEE